MQDKKDLTKPTSSRGAGVGRCVGSLCKGGKGEHGVGKGLLEALRKFREKREGKKNKW